MPTTEYDDRRPSDPKPSSSPKPQSGGSSSGGGGYPGFDFSGSSSSGASGSGSSGSSSGSKSKSAKAKKEKAPPKPPKPDTKPSVYEKYLEDVLGSQLSENQEAEDLQHQADLRYRRSLESIYEDLWGLNAPPGYIDRIKEAGMNIWEFEMHERAKPSFGNSPKYAEERLSLMAGLARYLGGF